MGKAILHWKVLIWINNIPFADFLMPQLSNLGFIISVVGVCFFLFPKIFCAMWEFYFLFLAFHQLSFAKSRFDFRKEQKFCNFDKKMAFFFKKIRPSNNANCG